MLRILDGGPATAEGVVPESYPRAGFAAADSGGVMRKRQGAPPSPVQSYHVGDHTQRREQGLKVDLVIRVPSSQGGRPLVCVRRTDPFPGRCAALTEDAVQTSR
ncbi:hypothetical protein GCM10010400_45100 [Streptomyces aculeolatus]